MFTFLPGYLFHHLIVLTDRNFPSYAVSFTYCCFLPVTLLCITTFLSLVVIDDDLLFRCLILLVYAVLS